MADDGGQRVEVEDMSDVCEFLWNKTRRKHIILFLQINQRKTYEYILKHGAHLAHVTDDEHLLASRL